MSRTRLKLAGAVAALVAAVVLVSGTLAVRSVRAREVAHLQMTLTARAELVRALLGAQGLAGRSNDALDALARQAARAAGARITLIDAAGAVRADSQPPSGSPPPAAAVAQEPEVAAALAGKSATATRRRAEDGRPTLYVALPAPGGGAVRLDVPLGSLEQQVASLERVLLVSGVIGIALALTLAYLLAGLVLRPVREIHRATASLAGGGTSPGLPWYGRDELGDVAAALQQVGDELQRRLREVSAEKERLSAVLQAMVEGVLVLDRSDRVVLANPRLRELLGIWGSVAGRHTLEVIRRPELEKALERAAREGEPVVVELVLGDGERVLQVHAVRFPAVGELLGTVAVFHDVTEVRRLEMMRKDFVANVSHELKTPLTAIRGFAETLAQGALPEERRRQYLEVIVRHAERLSALIEDLLELSRIEGRREPVSLSRVRVADLARSLLRDLQPRFSARGLEVTLEVEGEGTALADRRALEQVVTNLLDNAAKYTSPGGHVWLRVKTETSRVRVEVEDDGIGIPEEDQDRIFERFYRVDKARSRDLGGTGLGLAIVKHLVQAMGGEVFVRSREGEGSLFAFSIARD